MPVPFKPLAVIVSAIVIAGCNSFSPNVAKPATPYCLNGGSKDSFDCNSEKTAAEVAVVQPQVSDQVLHDELSELKAWLQAEREAILRGEVRATAAGPAPVSAVSGEYTQEAERIDQLASDGKHRKALAGLNTYLGTHPEDLAAQQKKARLLFQMKRLKEAEQLLERLQQENPARPELYNNLAVVLAARGDQDKATKILIDGMKTHPSYFQIHQNLQAIYNSAAASAYSQALDLKNAETLPELAMLDVGQESPVQTVVSLADNATSPVQPTVTSVEATQPSETETETETETSEAKTVAAATQPVKTAKPVASASEQPAAVVEKVENDNNSIAESVIAITHAWASAWSKQDVKSYLSHYVSDYRPNSRTSHSTWRKQREQRLSKPKFISVELSQMQLDIRSPESVRVQFRQKYRSDSYRDVSQKALDLVKIDGQWKIRRERSL